MKKFKKIISLLLCSVLVISACTTIVPSVSATENLTSGYFVYSILDDNTVEITDYTGDPIAIEVPESINGHIVTRIGRRAFAFLMNLGKVILPNTITSIGEEAFDRCLSLTDINIPDGVTKIENGAFGNCRALSSLELPDSVSYIGSDAFSQCLKLSNLTIPESVTYVGEDAFYKNKWLDNQPDGLIYAGKTLYMCKGEIEDVIIKDGTTQLCATAFEDCTTLKTVEIPDTVTRISSNAFSGCTELTEIIISDSVTDLESFVFNDCTNLQNVTLPKNLTTISDFLFRDCTSLTSIDIPATVTVIDGYAFYNCTNLKNVPLPENLKKIGFGAFYNCESLEQIIIPESVNEIERSAFSNTAWYNNQPDGLIYIGNIAYAHKGDCPDSVTIRQGTTRLGGGIFSNRENLHSITLPDSLTHIEAGAFYNCINLSDVKLPENLTHIGSQAFDDCPKLKYIVIPESVTKIESLAFGFTYYHYDDPIIADEPIRIKDFKIYGYKGTAAESYATRYEFEFIDLNENPEIPTVSTDPEPSEPKPTEPNTDPGSDIVISFFDSAKTMYVKEKIPVMSLVCCVISSVDYGHDDVITFTSSDPEIAKINKQGKLVALKAGTTTITATNSCSSDSIKLTVKNPKLNKKKITLKAKEKFKLKITGKVGKAKFISKDKTIAKVNAKGKIKALKKGKTVIKVKTNGIILKCKVKVTA